MLLGGALDTGPWRHSCMSSTSARPFARGMFHAPGNVRQGNRSCFVRPAMMLIDSAVSVNGEPRVQFWRLLDI